MHQYSRILQQTTYGNTFHAHRPHAKTSRWTSELLLLPELYQSAKAILILRYGADAWLPYMIPLYTETTKLGSKLVVPSGENEIGFELLSSLSIMKSTVLFRHKTIHL